MELPFVTSNPFSTEYGRQQKNARDQQTADAKNDYLNFETQQAKAEGPGRLHQVNAGADLTQAQATTAQANAGVAPQMAQAKLQEVRAENAALTDQQKAAKLINLTKMYEALDAGRTDLAQGYYTATGHNDALPPQLLQNANFRAQMKRIADQGAEIGKNDPQKGLEWQAQAVGALVGQTDQQQPGNTLTQPYKPVPGTPPIPETHQKPISVPMGGTLVDPQTGKPLFQSNATKWGVVGTDEYGNPVHGYPPPPGAGGPPPAGNPQQPGAVPGQQSAAPAPVRTAAADPADTGGSGTVSDTGNPKLGYGTAPPERPRGAEYLKTLPPGEADLVQGIAENRINPNSLSTKGGHRERILKEVAQYKDDYNQTLYSGATSYQRTAGSAGARVEMATNEVEQTLPLAMQASRSLPRGNFVPLNQLLQKYQQGTSDPAYNDFVLKNLALINAYSRAMNPQGVPRIAERMELHANQVLSTAVSPEAYEVQARALWQEVQRSRAAVAQTRGGTGPSANEASADAPMPGMPGGAGSAPNRPTATDPKTGHKLILSPDGSQWIPADGQ